jgi:hypothetical protein
VLLRTYTPSFNWANVDLPSCKVTFLGISVDLGPFNCTVVVPEGTSGFPIEFGFLLGTVDSATVVKSSMTYLV